MLVGNTNAQKIWNYLKSKGFNDYACAGIIGNLDCESGLNPKNLQDSCQARLGFDDDTYTALVDSGVYTKTQFVYDQSGYGIAQWTWRTRKQALYEFVRARSASVGDLESQLEFFYKELSTSFPSVLQALMGASSVREASDTILLKYECPADMSTSAQLKRASFGQKYYTQFTNSSTKGVTNTGYLYFSKGHSVKVSEHFDSTEFDCHGNGCCTQTIVNEKLVEYLENIRNHFNAPITITSPYRCQTHNSRVGGARASRHSVGDASDIVVKGVSPRDVAKYAESIGIMGIGLYETSGDGYFVHIDTRDKKSFWYGQKEEYRSTFGGLPSGVSVPTNTNNINTILNIGDIGSAVKAMQEKLIKLGYFCGDDGADGVFGKDTYNAVVKFQDAVGNICVDGIAGSQTLTALDKLIKDSNMSSVVKKVRVTASVLNVRSGAGMNYPVIANVRSGAVCSVIEENNGWGKIQNPSGWINDQYYEDI